MAPIKSVLISADSHVYEPADLWTKRLPRKFADNAPHVYWDEDKQAYLFGCEGTVPIFASGFFAAGTYSSSEGEKAFQRPPEEARPGGWDPGERLKDMAIDGVVADVLYTSVGFNLFWLTDAEFQEACFQVYNDWLAE